MSLKFRYYNLVKNNESKKTIFLIRHGQTGGNVKGAWLGSKSADNLNDCGKKQARYTGEYLKEQNVNANKIYSSPTPRALQHSEILQRDLRLPIEKIHSLSEINLGILEDRTREQGLQLLPQEIVKWHENLKKFEPPLGESAIEAGERFYETVKLIAEHCNKPEIIIVSHGVVIKLMLARILAASIETGETKIDVPWTTHGTITILKYMGRRFKFKEVVENKYPDSKEIAAFG